MWKLKIHVWALEKTNLNINLEFWKCDYEHMSRFF